MSRRPGPARRLAHVLGVPHLRHLDQVYARVQRAMDADEPDAVALRLAAIVHEQPAARAGVLVRRAGHRDMAPLVQAIVRGFGEVWKTDHESGLVRYVRRHRGHLRALLLFEVAHEGAPTPAMRHAAALGGLARPLASWTRRLARPPVK